MDQSALPKRAVLIVLALVFGACTPGATVRAANPPSPSLPLSPQNFSAAFTRPTLANSNPSVVLALTGVTQPATTQTPTARSVPPAHTTVTTVSSPPKPDLSTPSISELVSALTAGPGLQEAMAATQQALARGGMATTDLDKVFVPPVAPTALAVASF